MIHSVDGPLLALGAAAFTFGYLLGSIPFGVLLTRVAGAGDVRSIGSGNIGATNVLRTGRKGLAAATLLCDVLKGTLAVEIVSLSIDDPVLPLVAGVGAFLGHLFPIWLKLKGGKGVATYIGVLIALSWPIAIAFCVIWLLIAALTRYSSLSALVASVATPVLLWLSGNSPNAVLFVLLTILLWLRHHDNIARLMNGTEGRIGRKNAL
jgi:acyl phosphate:glycerol-3-phosphate acyltransferase